MPAIRRWFHRVVLTRGWLCFVIMVFSFFAFGVGSLNLFMLLRANANLLIDNGWQAVMDGGLHQSLELLVSGVLAMAAYVIFKTCEYRLVHWLGDADDNFNA